MAKISDTVAALRAAADALEALPPALRLVSLFGPLNSPANLRKEADSIEATRDAIVLAELEPEEPGLTYPPAEAARREAETDGA